MKVLAQGFGDVVEKLQEQAGAPWRYSLTSVQPPVQRQSVDL
jgi:hypothetical protein